MADATIALATVNAGRISPVNTAAVIKATITATATVYATATGGLPIDLYAILTACSNPAYPINAKDVLEVTGTSTLGWKAANWVAGTQTATTAPGTVRLWNGITEAADGATTASIPVLIYLSRNGGAL
jgi:hypothetical protein